jgi:protein O-mannosyl-transferase
METSDLRSKSLLLGAGLLMLVLGFAVYLPGLPGDFVFDDFSNIVSNPAVTSPIHSLNGLWQSMLSAPMGGLLRPISMLSFILNAALFGLSPMGFKIVNIGIHLCCGVLLWSVARELLRAYASASRHDLSRATIEWLSLASTTLWLVHPLNLTTVLYSVQRETSLGALFTAAAILAYLVGRRRQQQGKGRVLIWLVSPLCTVVGMLCKENAALTPLYLLVIEWTLLRFQAVDERSRREIYWYFIVFLLLPMLAVASLMAARPGFFFAAYGARDFTLYQRLLSESRILLDYLRWLAVPDLGQLGLFHEDILPSRGLLQPLSTLPSVAGIAALLATAVWLRRRLPLLSFGILWFFAGHVMESTILPLELTFEHRNYLPGFGLILGVVGTLYPWAAERGYGKLSKGVLGAALAILALSTTMRSFEWRSELSFAQYEAQHHPHSPRALTELEWAYMEYVITNRDRAAIPATVAAADRAKAEDPGSINQDVALAYMFAKLHDFPRAQAALRSAARRAPSTAPSSTQQLALQTLLDLTASEDRPLFADIDMLYRASIANPRVARLPCFASDMWNSLAMFRQATEEVPLSLDAMHQAVTSCPSKALLHANYARMLLGYGDLKDAKPEIDALRSLSDLRYLPELKSLEAEYAVQVQHETRH